MPTINQLSAVDSLSDGDLLAVFSTSNGDARKAALSLLATYLAGKIAVSDNKITQYASPNATGFNVQLNNSGVSTWLVLTPLAGYAAGTLTLPAVANCVDKQEILVNTTQAVTALTVAGNGATVNGAPTTLAANGFFRIRFDAVLDVWYRVG